MFLKSLSLKGFKSFAESTTLEFEPGVTVVVGPNGSGKSNVVDAIAWVLGAQAPTAVRSQKMDDVIFAGTGTRPPLGRAEVSLTIDNSQAILPIEFSEVTLSRTLFRTGESEYAINGVECRLLDIQELLSDSGVGRQQHVIISQGQIDDVLNARAEDRRAIIEEAAGVLKFRKRREKAERRLQSTEGNLARLQDLLREVRRQLRPLERQAEAARRHGDLIAELTALRQYEAGRELRRLRDQVERHARDRAELGEKVSGAERRLAELDAEILTTEAELGAMGADDLGDALGRCEGLVERGRGLVALMVERRRGVERERESFIDEALVATLTEDRSRVRGELDTLEASAEELVPRFDELAQMEAELTRRRETFDREFEDGLAQIDAAAAEARGELLALSAAIDKGSSQRAQLEARLLSFERDQRAANETQGRCTTALADVRSRFEEAERVRALNASAHAELAELLDEHRERVRSANAALDRWRARAEALEMALEATGAARGADHLAMRPGVLGSLRELVHIEPGWERAVEAALAGGLESVVVQDVAVARLSLDALASESVRGVVVPLGSHAAAWRPPAGVGRLRDRLRAEDPAIDALLDRLLRGVVVTDDLHRAVDAALTDPELTVVTASGDVLSPRGWRVGAEGAGATAAALDDARAEISLLGGELPMLEAQVAGGERQVDAAQAVHEESELRVATLTEELEHASLEQQAAELAERELVAALDSVRLQVVELDGRITVERTRVDELQQTLPGLEREEAEVVERGEAIARAREDLDAHATAAAALRTDLEVRVAAADERRGLLTERLSELDQRLERYEHQREATERRRDDLDRREQLLDHLDGIVGRHADTIEAELARLRAHRERQSNEVRVVAARLDDRRRARAALETELAESRERIQRTEIDSAETNLRLETHVEMIRRDLDTEPDRTLEAESPELPDGESPAGRVRELERELKLMGPINPLALEEFQALEERREFLQEQLDDVRTSRRELAKVIRAIDEEIVSVFRAAFVDVKENFEHLFSTLFPGGKGGLELTDPDDLLGTGIEISARPSGKNVKKLSLLSGGERSLTALAYLFAVFRSRPSPFYVMDEVEAALDDVNLHRFLELVGEFRDAAQLLIVSHQKRTMEAADVLYGVTMQPGGSSQVVAERVTESVGQTA